MNLSGRVSALLQQYALAAVLGIAVLIIALAGLGFLVTAYYFWLLTHFATAPAAAITGGTMFALAIITAFTGHKAVRRLKKPQGSLFGDAATTLTLGLRLAGLLVRRDPKKAIILATIAGAIAEYVLNDNRK